MVILNVGGQNFTLIREELIGDPGNFTVSQNITKECLLNELREVRKVLVVSVKKYFENIVFNHTKAKC